MKPGKIISIILLVLSCLVYAQTTPSLRPFSVESDNDFGGYDLLDIEDQKLFVLAEHWHNIRAVPKATLKTLRYLHTHGNVRILAIEQGKSVADMINLYLDSGDSTMLKHITRNTMFWGVEHRSFFKELRAFNLSLQSEERIKVQSIDIEYKMESAIFRINQLIGKKVIPASLQSTVGEFQRIYNETKEHREMYEGIAIMYYYDRDFVQQLVISSINDLEDNSQVYIDFFEDDFSQFATMILEMDDGLTFDYTNPNNNYRFRDKIIYKNFIQLEKENPDKGILCVIGMRHATKGSSIYDLNNRSSSPLQGKVMNIRISALYNKSINAGDLKKINFNFPKQLKVNSATLIKHDPGNSALKSSKDFDYTLFINESGSLTSFENILTEEY
ncbi:MAG: hypothetical protein AAF391_01340 [Bacteroidota bacterium]